MRHTSRAQSLVEMAMVLPFLLFLCFAIIDMGWFIYGYATIYNSARRGSELASQLPPFPSRLNNTGDSCAKVIFETVQKNAVMFPDLVSGGYVKIEYAPPPEYVGEPRRVGSAIQVSITNYPIRPLTPLVSLGRAFGFGSVGPEGQTVLPVSTVARRSIESLGNNPFFTNGLACQGP